MGGGPTNIHRGIFEGFLISNPFIKNAKKFQFKKKGGWGFFFSAAGGGH